VGEVNTGAAEGVSQSAEGTLATPQPFSASLGKQDDSEQHGPPQTSTTAAAFPAAVDCGLDATHALCPASPAPSDVPSLDASQSASSRFACGRRPSSQELEATARREAAITGAVSVPHVLAHEGPRDHYLYELCHHDIVRGPIFYIGITNDPKRREGEHRGGEVATTKAVYPALEFTFAVLASNLTKEEALEAEESRVRANAREYGVEAAHGGPFVGRHRGSLLVTERHYRGLCLECGGSGHFASRCESAATRVPGPARGPAAKRPPAPPSRAHAHGGNSVTSPVAGGGSPAVAVETSSHTRPLLPIFIEGSENLDDPLIHAAAARRRKSGSANSRLRYPKPSSSTETRDRCS
jgi:predicted GIY-YIG superfamily endonuclease